MIRCSAERRAARCRAILLTAACAIGCVGLAAFADTPHLISTPLDHEIKIDGLNTEWPSLDQLEDGPAFGAANDGQSLYLIVATSDQQMRRKLASGVIIWFDPKGGKKQSFGIGLPAASTIPEASALAPEPPKEGEIIGPPSSPSAVVDHFDVYGPGKNERHLVRLEAGLGMAIGEGTRQGMLVYELQVPLQKTDAHPYAVGAAPGSTVGLGLTTPQKADERGGRTGGGFGGGGGGFGGGMGGFGGRGGGGMGGGRPYPRSSDLQQLTPLKIWATLQLH